MVEQNEKKLNRKLKAILFADVVGYSALMSEDEVATHGLVEKSIDVFRTIIEANDGQLVQTSGDGLFALFDSAVRAVQSAIESQEKIGAENSKATQKIEFRIGINLGDVMVNNNTAHGNSVNIAARLESVAEPGSVCISSAVYEQVKNKLFYGYQYLGPKDLKNIKEQVETFAVFSETKSTAMKPSLRPIAQKRQELSSSKPSIAILPLKDLGDDPQGGWFTDGVTEDITVNLSKFHNLHVISRNSAFAYRDQSVPANTAADALGARYIALGSVRRAGSKARITIELTDTESGRMIWGERYDRSLDDIFEVQDEIARTIVSATAAQIEASEFDRVRTIQPNDIEAYGLVLHAQHHVYKYARNSNLEALKLFETAQNLDPRYARANAGVSRTHNIDWRYGWTQDPDTALDLALEHARQAIELDPRDARGFGELGFAHLYRKEHDAAIRSYELAVNLNPNDADLLAEMADALGHSGRNEEALELFEKAMGLNPFYPDQYLWDMGGVLYNLRRYEEVISTVLQMHNKSEGQRLLAASYAQLDLMEKAKEHAARVREAQPGFSASEWAKQKVPDIRQEDVENFVEGLKKAGL
ncbi:MAG: adenylate/guanylate cyclase domain-containing protein [Hyphomicrobiales bacterium]